MRVEEKLVSITGHHKTTHQTLKLIGRFLICEGELCAMAERVRKNHGFEAYVEIAEDAEQVHRQVDNLVAKIDTIWFSVDRQLARIVEGYEELVKDWAEKLDGGARE